MGWLIRTVAVLVQWAIFLPLWVVGSKVMYLVIWLCWGSGIFLAMNAGPTANTPATVIGVAGCVLVFVMMYCRWLTREKWRPAGFTAPTRRAREAAVRSQKQPTWARAAVAVDAPSAETARARLAPRLQMLMRPAPSSGPRVANSG